MLLLLAGTSVVHDPQETFKSFFQTVISTEFKDQGLMYDALDFLLKNLTKISETNILTDYFPNLFKVHCFLIKILIYRNYSSLYMFNSDVQDNQQPVSYQFAVLFIIVFLPIAPSGKHILSCLQNIS